METKFQTSFIPKKPFTAQESSHIHSGMSLIMLISVILFVASVGVAGFTLIAKTYLNRSQDQLKINLADNEKRFDLPLIEKIKKANLKIDLANQLLKNHVAVSEALAIVGGLTAEKVHFSNFDFSSGSASPSALASSQGSNQTGTVFKIQMKGVADTFNTVAFQSDVMGRSDKYGTNKVLKNPVLSDLNIDASGNINFSFGADLSLPDISYEKALSETLQAEGNTPTAGVSGQPNQ